MIEMAPAGPSDLHGIADLEQICFPLRQRWDHELWAEQLANEHIGSWTARADQALVGVVTLRRGLDADDLDRIFVHPEHRGRQIARLLLDQALANTDHPVLLEVQTGNQAALGLYRAFGFEQLAVRKDYYGRGLDALVLQRPALTAPDQNPGPDQAEPEPAEPEGNRP